MEDPKFLHKLEKGRQRHGITVRVVRKWTIFESSGSCKPLYIGLVLADAKGDSMYAEIPDDLIEDYEEIFNLGKVYTINKFLVNNAKTSYRPVNKKFMIEITKYTSAEVVRDFPASIPEYVYSLTPFPAIKTERVVYNYTDVIGYLIKYKALHTFVPKNTEKVKMLREIYIKDLRENVMKITLWGNHASNFNIDHIYHDEIGNLVVCLIVGCIPKEEFQQQGKTCLTGSPACCYYFNPNIPEAARFHARFKNIPIYIERPPPEEIVENSLQDIELPQKKIAQLTEVDPFDDQGPFKCEILIHSIVRTSNWWYMSCRPCKKKAEQQVDGRYKCPVCLGFDTIPRYLLTFIGKDETGEARFFAYDDQAQKIVQKECQSIMNPLQPKDALPQALQKIINKKYTFSVDLTDDSCKGYRNRQYQVKAVLERPSRNSSTQETAITENQLATISSQQGDPTRTEASSQLSPPPKHPPEILAIETTPLSTPVPTIEAGTSGNKDKLPGSPKLQTHARRKLLPNDSPVDKADTEGAGNECSDEFDQTTSDSGGSLQQKTKKAKNTKTKKDGGHSTFD